MSSCDACKRDLAASEELRCPGCKASFCAGHVEAGPWHYLTQVAEDQVRTLKCPRGHEWKEYSR